MHNDDDNDDNDDDDYDDDDVNKEKGKMEERRKNCMEKYALVLKIILFQFSFCQTSFSSWNIEELRLIL